MVFLYNISLRFFHLGVRIASLFNPKARQWLKGRKGWRKFLIEKIDSSKPVAWFHCASLGEFEQGRPLIETLAEAYPNYQILVSFFSPSGYEVRKNYSKATAVCYLPLDTKRNAKQFIAIVKPQLVFFIKYEFWYHYLSQLHKQDVPTYLVSGIFRPTQIFFKRYGKWNRKMLFSFNHLFVQNTQSASLLESIGVTNVSVTGDTRFDRVYATAQKAEKHPALEEFCQDSLVLVAGSTWPKDEELLLSLSSLFQKDIKLIIAPHEIESARIDALAKSFSLPSLRLTQLQPNDNLKQARILFIDTIGLLASAYGQGHIAYVGGGFGVGIHNTLEPATFGMPVIFGPNYHKFQEAVELISRGGAFAVGASADLQEVVTTLLVSNNREEAGAKSHEYVNQNIGATKAIMAQLKL